MTLLYILQIQDLSMMLFFGVINGILYGIANIPNKIKKNIIYQIICDILFTIIFTFIFIFLVNILNDGEIRLFLIIGYLLGFLIERITLGKLFAKGFKFIYNKARDLFKLLHNSTFGRIIFK